MSDLSKPEFESSVDIRDLNGQLEKLLPDLTRSSTDIVALAFRHLTGREREFVVLKLKVGAKAREIMKRFGFGSRRALQRHWRNLIKVVKIYIVYFATCDYEKALRLLKAQMPRPEILLDIFGGCPGEELNARHGLSRRELEKYLNMIWDTAGAIEDPDLRELIRTILHLRQYRRL